MKNRKLIQIIGIGLITSLLSGSLNVNIINAAEGTIPVPFEEEIEATETETDSVEALAAAASKNSPKRLNVTLKKLSGDFLSGYYAVYEVNGHEYRSDCMGTKYNQMAWNELSTEDKRKLLVNYSFAPKEMQKQFGEENTAAMLKWYEDYSGLTEARQILKDRIANREFPTLSYFFSEEYEQRSKVEIPESKYNLNIYTMLPEVSEYLKIDSQMRACYNTGRSAYKVLVDAKTGQISTAIKGLSAVIIKQLICDRVLVPAVSPGGLSALVPEIKGELWNLYDNLNNTTNDIYACCGLGDWPDGKSARKIIDDYWVIINSNEKYATICVDKFMELKAQKRSKHDAAVAAVEEYISECDKKNKEKLEEIQEDKTDTDPTLPQIDTSRLEGETDDEWKRRIISLLNKKELDLIDEYYEWKSAVNEDANTKRDKIRKIGNNYSVYSSDTYSSMITNCINYGNYDALLNDRYYPEVTDQVPAAFEDAISQVDEYKGKLEEYEKEYNAQFEKYSSEWDSFESRLKGLNKKMEEFGSQGRRETFLEHYIINNEDVYSTPVDDYYTTCGNFHYQDNGEIIYVSFDQMKEMMDKRKQEINDRKPVWSGKLEAYEQKLRSISDEYAEMLELEGKAAATYEAENQTAESILNESDQIYFKQEEYTVGRTLQSEELQKKYDTYLSNRDAAGLSALCDSWGADLGQRMDSWHTATAKRNEAKNDLVRAKHKANSILRTMTGTSADFNDIVDYLNKINGTSYKYYDDIAPSYGSGSQTTYAAGDSAHMAGAMYTSYIEFADCNAMAFEYDMYYSKMLQHKPNYMRGIERQDKLLAPYHDGSGSLFVEPGIIPLYGSYYQNYKYTAPIWMGLSNMTGSKGEEKALQLFNENVKGSWAYELKHGYVPVTGLIFEEESTAVNGIALETGEAKDLTSLVKILPENASDKILFWESDNPDVIVIDENGVGTAVGDGVAVLTVRARDSAFVENDDGTVTYTPAPLTLTVTVGGGINATSYWNTDSTWKNYGTDADPKLYRVKTLSDRNVMVTCSVSSVTASEAHIVVSLFDDDGGMLASEILPYTVEPGFRTVSLIADPSGGLTLKAFALKADKTLAPLDGELLINEKIK